MDDSEDTRRAARAQWTAKVYRNATPQEMDDDDARFWDSVPIEERAELVWRLSQELFTLAGQAPVEALERQRRLRK